MAYIALFILVLSSCTSISPPITVEEERRAQAVLMAEGQAWQKKHEQRILEIAARLIGAAENVEPLKFNLAGRPFEGWTRLAALRVLLLALNVLALAMLPAVIGGFRDTGTNDYTRGYRTGVQTGYANGQQDMRASIDKKGLYLDGTWVSNIYPYDAKGRPLVGVQLFNQVGKPINVITQAEAPEETCDDATGECAYPAGTPLDANGNGLLRVFYPWTNGAAQLLNVFPIPSRFQESDEPDASAFTEKVKPQVGPFPLASVPGVSLPGIRPGVQKPAVQE